MKNLLLSFLILITLNIEAQTYLPKSTFDAFLARYKIDTAASNKSIRDLQKQMTALTTRVVNLEAFQSAQMMKNTDFAAAIKTLELEVANLKLEDTIFFDTLSFRVEGKHVYFKHPFLDERIKALEEWKPTVQASIDELIAYMNRLKQTVFINPFPQ